MHNPAEPARPLEAGWTESSAARRAPEGRPAAGVPTVLQVWRHLMIRRNRRLELPVAFQQEPGRSRGAPLLVPSPAARNRPEWDPEEEIRSSLTVLHGVLQLLARPQTGLPPELRRLVEGAREAERELERALFLGRALREVAVGEEPGPVLDGEPDPVEAGAGCRPGQG